MASASFSVPPFALSLPHTPQLSLYSVCIWAPCGSPTHEEELGNLIAENRGLDVDKGSHPRSLMLIECQQWQQLTLDVLGLSAHRSFLNLPALPSGQCTFALPCIAIPAPASCLSLFCVHPQILSLMRPEFSVPPPPPHEHSDIFGEPIQETQGDPYSKASDLILLWFW
jgi:hypothetical protein